MSVRTHLMARDAEREPMSEERLAKARNRYWANPEHCRAIARKSYYKYHERNKAAARARMAKRVRK